MIKTPEQRRMSLDHQVQSSSDGGSWFWFSSLFASCWRWVKTTDFSSTVSEDGTEGPVHVDWTFIISSLCMRPIDPPGPDVTFISVNIKSISTGCIDHRDVSEDKLPSPASPTSPFWRCAVPGLQSGGSEDVHYCSSVCSYSCTVLCHSSLSAARSISKPNVTLTQQVETAAPPGIHVLPEGPIYLHLVIFSWLMTLSGLDT